MKKVLIMALLAATGFASAADTVSVYGIVDGGIESANKQGTGHNSSQTAFTGAGGSMPDLFGISAAQDLGNGIRALGRLEGSFNLGTGSGTTGANNNGNLFGREAYVGLASGGATVKLGLQLDPAVLSYFDTDPRGGQQSFSGLQSWINSQTLAGSSANSNTAVSIFDSNAVSVGFTSGGTSVTALYSTGGVAGSAVANSLYSIGGKFVAGPVTVSAGTLQTKAAGSSTTAVGEYNVGAAVAIDAVTVRANFLDVKPTTVVVGTVEETKTYGVGADLKLGSTTLNGSYYESRDSSNSGKMSTVVVGADHALSKKVGAYIAVASIREDSNYTLGTNAIATQNGMMGAPGQTVVGTVAGLKMSF
jgi:predicted porin